MNRHLSIRIISAGMWAALIFVVSCSMHSLAPTTPANGNSPEKTDVHFGITRNYSETDLDDIFTGRTAQPQSRALQNVIVQQIKTVVGKSPRDLGMGNLEAPKRITDNGFSIGEITFQDELVLGKVSIHCGVRRGEMWSLKTVTFAEAENYLREKILKRADDQPQFQRKSFTGENIGEAVWHRRDKKSGDYEIVWLRGLTIVHIKIQLKNGDDLKKNIGEKLDAAALKIDQWITQRMR